jgi:hypothetical protein
MRKKLNRPLWQIIPLMVVLPPVGFVVLWRSSHKALTKYLCSAIIICLICGGIAGISKAGYGPWGKKKIPPSGIAVEMDKRNRYIIPEILPREREIFNEVVKEIHNVPPSFDPDARDITTYDPSEPRSYAFEAVAKRTGLDPKTVAAVYRKVSMQLIPHNRK